VYRISTYVPEANLQFNQFLVKDDEPFLYPTGRRGLFPFVCEALARILKPESIRWLGFSHFEVDECGALNEWLMIAPNAQTVCSQVGALVNLNDFAKRRPAVSRGVKFFILAHTDSGFVQRLICRAVGTPACPSKKPSAHYSARICFTKNGDVEPLTQSDIIGRARKL
jgi:hypothetical protein